MKDKVGHTYCNILISVLANKPSLTQAIGAKLGRAEVSAFHSIYKKDSLTLILIIIVDWNGKAFKGTGWRDEKHKILWVFPVIMVKGLAIGIF